MVDKKESRPGGNPERDGKNSSALNSNRNIDSESTLEAALGYASLGWLVFPIKQKDKKPLTKHGFKDATTDHEAIKRWFSKWPDCNIAVRTGPESKLAVLDIDAKSNGLESLAMLEQEFGNLPETLTAKTGGGGKHYFFRYPPGGFKNSAGKISPGIDTRGDGGYVVVAPSVHVSGSSYFWHKAKPEEIELAKIPEWIFQKMAETPKALSSNKKTGIGSDKIFEGGRNDYLFREGCRFRSENLDVKEITDALLEENKKICDPPLEMAEVKKIAQSCGRYQKGDSEDKRTQSQILIELASDWELFHSPDGEVFATMSINGHQKTYLIKSQKVRQLLTGSFYKRFNKPPGAPALMDALGVLEAKAIFDGNEYPVFTRVAGLEGNIYLDLCNDQWEVVEVTTSGWRIISESPVKFIRSRGMRAIPTPVKGGSVDELNKFLNVHADQWKLIVGFLLACLRPTGPFPILIVQGEQGSGKSILCRILRKLVDPFSALLKTLPKDERDLMIAAKNSWVLAFDNLSGLSLWIADALCRLSTGGGFATRELYTDSEEVIFDYQRPQMLNGIDNISVRSDLRDRSEIICLPTINETHRKDEEMLYCEFEEARPRILGGLLDGVSAALQNKDSVKLVSTPRMADFAKWVTAAEPGLGWETGAFMEVYNKNRESAIEIGIESDVVAQVIIDLSSNGEWRGTMTELLEKLTVQISSRIAASKTWPKSSSALSDRLRRLAPVLREVGIELEFSREGSGGQRLITIRKSAKKTVSAVSSVKDDDIFSIDGAADDADGDFDIFG